MLKLMSDRELLCRIDELESMIPSMDAHQHSLKILINSLFG
jgi:hypothetical protein